MIYQHTELAPLNLTDRDLSKYRSFRISDELLRLHGVRRVTSSEARTACGIQFKGDLSGVAWPIWGADGEIKAYRVRRDNPEIENAKPKAKYVHSVDRPHLFFELTSREHLENVNVSVIFVEAASSALAIASWSQRTGRQFLIIATHGCWGWKGKTGKRVNENGVSVDEKGPSPDLAHIPFAGREAFILFDSNITTSESVRIAANMFKRELQDRGATVRIARIPEKCGDYSVNGPDDYLKYQSDEDFSSILDSSEIPKVKSNDEPFRLTEDCVLYREEFEDRETGEKRTEWRRVCSYLEIDSETRDLHGENWGRVLIIKDRDGRIHEWPMPMSLTAGDGTSYREQLLSMGLEIEPGKGTKDLLQLYITTARPERRSRCVSRVGWHTTVDSLVYALPNETFGASRERVIIQSSWTTNHPYQVSGDLTDWQDNVAKYCSGNSRLAFSVSLGFASPLLNAINEQSGGIHLRGQSSTGKTTALCVAGSVWGGEGINGFIRSWRATSNGLEAVAESHNDALLCLDEISQVDSREAGEIAYMLANGSGKGRARRDGSSRQSAEWRLLFLSTGEVGLADKMSENGQRPQAGQEVRLVDIPADAGAGFGIFENLHGFNEPSALANKLRSSSLTYYGSPIREFLRKLTAIKPETVARGIQRCREDFTAKYVPADASGQVRRVANRFALIASAGLLATDMGILPWSDEEAMDAAGGCFISWIQSRGTSGNQESITAVRQVRKFFENHGNSRFQDWDSPNQLAISRVGYRKRDEITGATDFHAMSEAFRSEICVGLDHKFVVSELLKRGYLISGSDGRPTVSLRLPALHE